MKRSKHKKHDAEKRWTRKKDAGKSERFITGNRLFFQHGNGNYNN